MTSHIRIFLAMAWGALFWAESIHAGEPEIIAKARARLGSEQALDSITSIHYVATVVTADPNDPAKAVSAKLDMIVQKPDRQLITTTYEKLVETTALDSFEAWTRLEDPGDSTKVRVQLLDPAQVKRLRANTQESLFYFRLGERFHVEVENQGAATIDGISCQKIAFIHDPQIIFYRYFDVASSRLVRTETESGGTFVEEGEMMIGGVRFPEKLVTRIRDAKGAWRTATLTYEKVTLNESFPPALFAVPSPKAR